MEESGPAPDQLAPAVSGLRRRVGRETYFLRQAVRRPKMFKRRARRTLSPKVAFLESNHHPSRSLLVVGSARSGTTWLAEVLADSLHGRLVFEPLRTETVPLARPVRFGHFLDPGRAPDPTVAHVLDKIMAGRVRTRWTDEYNTVRFARCRVVKEIRATNLLPWIVRRYPRTPVVYLLRHPVPSSWSVAQLGWPDKLQQFLGQESLMQGPLAPFGTVIDAAAGSTDPFHRFVLRWCLENFVPTELLDAGQAHVVFYEHLVEDPRAELARLSAFLRRFSPGTWNVRLEGADTFSTPSHTNYRGTDVASGSDRLDDWVGEVSAPQVEAALALVNAFGLDRIYGATTSPRIAPEAVLGGRGRTDT
jgi:hypothetical protein